MPEQSLGEALAPHLPFVRRYSRALTGSQTSGDTLVRATLEAIIAAPDQFPNDADPRVGLYRMFETMWLATYEAGGDAAVGGDRNDDAMTQRTGSMTPLSRRALLLTTMEGFTYRETGQLLGVDEEEVERLAGDAMREIKKQTRARVLIIEDEPIIAMDIQDIVENAGHDVAGVAVTRDEAVDHFRSTKPDLVLADIQLADNSSGIDAVNDMLKERRVPVIFITAFPERLLTGEKPEPAFLLTKPFSREAVAAAIAQALFFNISTPA